MDQKTIERWYWRYLRISCRCAETKTYLFGLESRTSKGVDADEWATGRMACGLTSAPEGPPLDSDPRLPATPGAPLDPQGSISAAPGRRLCTLQVRPSNPRMTRT